MKVATPESLAGGLHEYEAKTSIFHESLFRNDTKILNTTQATMEY